MFLRSKFRWLILAPLICVWAVPTLGQEQGAGGWPQISKNDLALKDNPDDPGASAIILYREVSDDDVKGSGTEIRCIKVLTEEGKKYADIEISYIPKVREVEDIRARVLQPDGKVEEFNGQIFDKTSLKFRKYKIQVKAFTLPDVRAGSVIEYAYTVRWRWKEPDYLKNPSQYVFTAQWTIPTVNWEIQEDLYTRRASFSIRPFPNVSMGYSLHELSSTAKPQKLLDGRYTIDVHNIPAFHEEEFMPPEGAVRSSVHFYYLAGGVQSADSYWSSIALNEGQAIEKFLDKKKAMESAVRTMVSPEDSDMVKLQKIYARAQQLRFLSFEFSKTQKEEKNENLHENKNVEDILKHNYARANEANLLFVGLARGAGFEAWPARVASRESGYFDHGYPSEAQLNAMIVGVHAGSKDLFLDPATLFCPFGLLPWGESDTQGIRLAVRGPVDVKTPRLESTQAVVRREIYAEMRADGTLEGTLHVSFVGQEALNRRLAAYQKDDAGRKKGLEDEVKGWLPMGASATLTSSPEWEKTSDTLEAEFTLRVPNLGTQAGHHWVLPLALCEASQKYPFQSAQRTQPIDFHYPYEEFDKVVLKTPPGYAAESLPKGRNTSFEWFAKYSTTYEAKPDSVEFDRHLVMGQYKFGAQYYSVLRGFYEGVRDGDGDQIVLKAEETHANK